MSRNTIEKFNSNRHVYISNFIDQNKCEELTNTFKNGILSGKFFNDPQCNKSLANQFGIFDPLLEELQPRIEEATGITLYPTVSYCRWYLPEEELTIHQDRPACEISVTLTVGFQGSPWSIFMGQNQDKTNASELKMNVGDIVIYRGCELFHWREKYVEGDWQAQIFLHYVDANGPFKEWKYDKKLGMFHQLNEKGELRNA